MVQLQAFSFVSAGLQESVSQRQRSFERFNPRQQWTLWCLFISKLCEVEIDNARGGHPPLLLPIAHAHHVMSKNSTLPEVDASGVNGAVAE